MTSAMWRGDWFATVGGLTVEKWFYLSFADGDRWLGATHVKGVDPESAIRDSRLRGLNPGGGVLCIEIAADIVVPASVRYKLFTDLAELERVLGLSQPVATNAPFVALTNPSVDGSRN